MSSNAALSAARRRRSNPLNANAGNMSGPPPANRVLQRMGGVPPPPPSRMMTPQLQPQLRPGLAQQQQQQQMKKPPHQQSQQNVKMQSSLNALPPLPPPNKNAGQLYGIPLHPLIMFQTHDNKLNEHDLSITECFDQLKDIDTRLSVFETKPATAHEHVTEEPATDLNELINDSAFIGGVVDNIMSTTNFASIIENVIPLQEENQLLKQRISEQEVRSEQMHVLIQHLEERLKSIEYELAQPYEEVTLNTTDSKDAPDATEEAADATKATEETTVATEADEA
jgi:hypothetical protein